MKINKIMFFYVLLSVSTCIAQVKIGSNPTVINAGTTNLQVEGTTSNEQFVVLKNGNVGIGTITPSSTLEIDGAATNSKAFNAGNSSIINFATSNIAYTSSTTSNITLTNIKDGGAYTLIFTNPTTTGAVIFSSTGFSFINVGTTSRVSSKIHLYNIIVAGTVAYITMGTEN